MKSKRANRNLQKLIEQLGLSGDFTREKADSYGMSYYFKFSDGTVVMSSEELENYLCTTEQSWFWRDFQNYNLSKPDWIMPHLDVGADWKDSGDNIIEYIIEDVVSKVEYLGGGVFKGDSLQDVYDNILGVDIAVGDIQVDAKEYFADGWNDSGYLVLTSEYTIGDFLVAKGFNGWGNVDQSDIQNFDQVLELFDDIDNELGAQSSKLYTLIEDSEDTTQSAILLVESLLDKDYKVDGAEVHVLYSIKDILSDIANRKLNYEQVDGFYIWVYDQVASQLPTDNVFSVFLDLHPSEGADWQQFIDLNEPLINDSICDGLEIGLDGFEEAPFVNDLRYTIQIGDWYIASDTDYSKSNRRASMSKKANWWNTTIVFDYGTDFRLHIGAEQSFSAGSSSLDRILSNSMPRVKKETYEPILELLSNNPDIGIYRPSSFDELHMDSRRKSVILGWSLSGVKPRDMDLAAYLKSNGIKGYIVKG